MIFSISLFYGGIAGVPRRTNMGLSYSNPASPLFRADWRMGEVIGAVGGTVMFIAMVMYFIVFFGTLAKARVNAGALEFPVSELYYDEDVVAVQSLRPWLVGAVVLLIVAYTVPFIELAQQRYEGTPAYNPASPVALQR